MTIRRLAAALIFCGAAPGFWLDTDQGGMDPGLLYEPPFTDIASAGPEQVFDDASVERLLSVVQR